MKVIEKRKYPPVCVRRTGRRKALINARARIIIHSQALNLLEMGQATVRHISPNRASITDLELPSQSLPTAPFIIDLHIQEGPLSNFHMTCSVTRFSNNGKLSLDLKIDKIAEKQRVMLEHFVKLQEINTRPVRSKHDKDNNHFTTSHYSVSDASNGANKTE